MKQAVVALVAYPALEEFILIAASTCTKFICNMDGLNWHITSLMRDSLGKLQADIENTHGLPEYARNQR